MRKETKYALLQKLVLPTHWLLYLYAKTLRMKIENAEVFLNHIKNGGRILFASWHQRFFGGFYAPRIFNLPQSIMISRSRDGDFIAAVVTRIGWRAVRGSSSLGGKEALKEMIQALMADRMGVHIVDGPLGPPHIIKPGLISLAQRTGAVICPLYISYEHPWIFDSWDRFMVPKPFSRVLLRFEKDLTPVPSELDTRQFEQILKQIETQMIRGYESADSSFEGQKRLLEKGK